METEQSRVDTAERLNSSLSLLKETIPIILSLGAIFASAGFLIVNSYLSQFGTVQGYAVIPGRYLSAALWLLPFFVIAFGYGMTVSNSLKKREHGAKICIGLFLLWVVSAICSQNSNPATWEFGFQLLYIFSFVHVLIVMYTLPTFLTSDTTENYNRNDIRNLLIRLLKMTMEFLDTILKYTNLGLQIISILITVWIVASLFIVIVYPRLPQYLGGGQPLQAQLILETSEVTDLLPISRITGTQQTKDIFILSELTDGLLVHDETLNTTMIIKDKYIGAIIGVNVPIPVSGTNP